MVLSKASKGKEASAMLVVPEVSVLGKEAGVRTLPTALGLLPKRCGLQPNISQIFRLKQREISHPASKQNEASFDSAKCQ